MAITFPRSDIITSVKYSDQTIQLVSRQEYSTQANGVVRGKDFGSALWQLTYTTVEMLNRDAIAFEAALNSLDGVVNPFYAGDLRNRFPRSVPSGVFSDTGVLAGVNANNKAIAISGLPAGFVISAGDYLAFDYGTSPVSRALHQAVETITADGTGLTAQFEVRPYLRAGWTVSTPIIFKQANGQFTLMPASVTTTLKSAVTSQISFKAMQYL